LNLKPNHEEAGTQLGLIHYWSGLNDEAIACLNKALEMKPASVSAHHFLRVVRLRGKKDYASEVQNFRKVLEIKPNQEWTEYYLNVALCAQGGTAEADQHITRAYLLNQEDKEIAADYKEYITDKR